MLIRSQDKKELVTCTSFSITRNFGGSKKSCIVGTVSTSFWGNKTVILGFYDTTEQSITELTKLQTALVSDEKIFEMN
jgi:hypothetical protein